MNIQQEIRPISDLRTHAAEMLTHAKETGRPVMITKNGLVEGAVIDNEMLQNIIDFEHIEAVAKIKRAMDQIEAGQGIPADEFFAQFEAEHGITV